MLRGQLAAAARGRADDEGDADLASAHVAEGGGVVEDLVQRQQAEVDGHDLDDRPEAGDGRPDPRADEGRLRQRRVADAVLPELFQQSLGDGEAPAVTADVLAHQEHALVRGQRGP